MTPPHGDPSPGSRSCSPQVSPNSMSPPVDVTEDTGPQVFVSVHKLIIIVIMCVLCHALYNRSLLQRN